jgi:hypothetical protein
MAIARMLDDASKLFERVESRREAPIVVAKFVLMRLACATVPEPAPPLAWWMGHNRIWTSVESRIAQLAPCVDAWLIGIDAIGLDVERGDHGKSPTLLNYRLPGAFRS